MRNLCLILLCMCSVLSGAEGHNTVFTPLIVAASTQSPLDRLIEGMCVHAAQCSKESTAKWNRKLDTLVSESSFTEQHILDDRLMAFVFDKRRALENGDSAAVLEFCRYIKRYVDRGLVLPSKIKAALEDQPDKLLDIIRTQTELSKQ